MKKIITPNNISIGVTWVAGKIFIKPDKKQSQLWYGICNYAAIRLKEFPNIGCIFAVTPEDYDGPKMITTINVSEIDGVCERADSCLNFNCFLNKFNKQMYLIEFKDCGALSLGLPADIGTKPLWFNDKEWAKFFCRMAISPEGGRLEFSEERWLNRTQKIFNKE